jgi:hypothetical protein
MTSKITRFHITPKEGDWKNGTHTEVHETIVDDAWFVRAEESLFGQGATLLSSHGFTIKDLDDGITRTTKDWDLADLERLFTLWATIKAKLIEAYPEKIQ